MKEIFVYTFAKIHIYSKADRVYKALSSMKTIQDIDISIERFTEPIIKYVIPRCIYNLSTGKMIVDLFKITIHSVRSEMNKKIEDVISEKFHKTFSKNTLLYIVFFIFLYNDSDDIKYYIKLDKNNNKIIETDPSEEEYNSRLILDEVLGKEIPPDQKARILLEYYSVE